MSLLSQKDINDIASVISSIISDDVISTDVKYKMTGTTVSTWDPITQTIPDMWTTSSVSAFKGGYSLNEILQSNGIIETGDVKFIIMLSAVSGILCIDDFIVESASTIQSATTYTIKNIGRDPLGICYFLQSRSV